MATTYGPLFERVWRDALLLPGYDDLFRSLSAEVGDFLHVPEEAAADAIAEAWRSRTQDARNRFPAVVTEESLAEFYRDSSSSVLVSAYWHSLRPDRYALHSVAALHALQMYADGSRVFEVGHGIGSTALLFARHGLDVTIGDVSDDYISFARRRFGRRDLPVSSLDLRTSNPLPRSQDVVVCLDVLEHVLEPFTLLESMVETLDDGGLLVLNVAFGTDPDTPEHLLRHRVGFLDRVRSLNMEPIPHPTLEVFWARRQARWERPIRRVQDILTVSTHDLAARLPRVGRVFRRTVAPPLASGIDLVGR